MLCGHCSTSNSSFYLIVESVYSKNRSIPFRRYKILIQTYVYVIHGYTGSPFENPPLMKGSSVATEDEIQIIQAVLSGGLFGER